MTKTGNGESEALDQALAALLDFAARANLIPEMTAHLGPELTKEALAAYDRHEAREAK